ncbi:hypothetical protein [Calothrix rhizosoleniae]|uniref:hypothetical protein n=1 Tax=Calothrix rhizosoleniae TaxID=888997 RepID=UPI000B4A2D81|nr:hypothetical protein [Calothrix rhizosoleniae]
MFNFIFKGLTKKLERSLNHSSTHFAEKNRKEISKLFDKKVYPLADKLDYIAKKRIEKTLNGLDELEHQTKNDIKYLIDHTDKKVSQNIQEIDTIRREIISDLRETIGEADYYLENRINQITLSIMEGVSSIETVTNNAFAQANFLEERIFQDANQIIDQLNEIIGGETEIIRNELKKILAHSLPNPFDKCRRTLKLETKPGMMLSDIELYRLTECYELNKIDEKTQINEILQVYGQLQLNATRMAYLARNSPELKRQAVADWIHYGILCEFWRNTVNTYQLEDSHINILLPSD